MTTPVKTNDESWNAIANKIDEVGAQAQYEIVKTKENVKDGIDQIQDSIDDFVQNSADDLRDDVTTFNALVGVDGTTELQETMIAGHVKFAHAATELVSDVSKEVVEIGAYSAKEELRDVTETAAVIPKLASVAANFPEDPTVIPVGQEYVVSVGVSADVYAGVGAGVSNSGEVKIGRPSQDQYELSMTVSPEVAFGLGAGSGSAKIDASLYASREVTVKLVGDADAMRSFAAGDFFDAANQMKSVEVVRTDEVGIKASAGDFLSAKTGLSAKGGVQYSDGDVDVIVGANVKTGIDAAMPTVDKPGIDPLNMGGGLELGFDGVLNQYGTKSADVNGTVKGEYRGDSAEASVSLGTDGLGLSSETSVRNDATFIEADLEVVEIKAGFRKITSHELRL